MQIQTIELVSYTINLFRFFNYLADMRIQKNYKSVCESGVSFPMAKRWRKVDSFASNPRDKSHDVDTFRKTDIVLVRPHLILSPLNRYS